MAFLSHDLDTVRTSRLAECAKAVNKTNLGRRIDSRHNVQTRVW